MADLLGALFGAHSLDELRNPDFSVDEQGNVSGGDPYKKPGFFTRVFHPELTQQAGEINATIANLRNNANLQHGIANSLEAGDINTGFTGLQKPMEQMSPAELAQASKHAPSLYTLQGIQANRAAKIPELQAHTLASTLKNEGVEADRAGEINLPTQRADTGLAVAKNAATQAGLDESMAPDIADFQKSLRASARRLLPSREKSELAENSSRIEDLATHGRLRPLSEANTKANLLEDTNRANRNLGAADVLDEIYANDQKAKIAESRIAQRLAAEKEGLIEPLVGLQRNTIYNQAWDAAHPPAATSPFFRTQQGGIGVNSDHPSLNAKIKGEIGEGVNASGGVVPLHKGLNIAPVNSPLPTPTSGTTNTPVSNQMTDQDQIEHWFHQMAMKKEGGNTAGTMRKLSDLIAAKIGLTQDLPMFSLGGSRFHSKEPGSVVYDAFTNQSKNLPSLTQDKLFAYLRSLPIEEQMALYKEALQ